VPRRKKNHIDPSPIRRLTFHEPMVDSETVRLGLISDIQYADQDDGTDFSGEEQRHFRHALQIVANAVDTFNAQGVDAIVQLGDIIDGSNARLDASETALETVLSVFAEAHASTRFDLIGNHELYNFQRPVMASNGLHLSTTDVSYYHQCLNSRWDALFLDAYEIATIGWPEYHENRAQGLEILKAKNPQVLNGSGDWFTGLPEDKHRFVPYNGAFSATQIEWVRHRLISARDHGRSVLVFTHVPVYAPATRKKNCAWNCEDLLEVLHSLSDVVTAVFAGHDHSGGYAVDGCGIHHVTLSAPLTAAIGDDRYAVLECHDGWAHMFCHGRVVVESATNNRGRCFQELLLAKGSVNQPA
jgi:manganese-dependent ADP-ribose/CDP-alcohol diphosphatase